MKNCRNSLLCTVRGDEAPLFLLSFVDMKVNFMLLTSLLWLCGLVTQSLHHMPIQRRYRASTRVEAASPDVRASSSNTEEADPEVIWTFWETRRKSIQKLKNALADDTQANVTQEFEDYRAHTCVEKEHVRHLNELFMAAMGEGSSEIMDFLWMDSSDAVCVIEPDESTYVGYRNITNMWKENFLIQAQQQQLLLDTSGRTYRLQVEQLDEPILHFYGDMAVIQTEILVSCLVSQHGEVDFGRMELESAAGVQKRNRKQENGRDPDVGSPMRLFVSNVFLRPPTSDRYFLYAHSTCRDEKAQAGSKMAKEAYMDDSARDAQPKKPSMGGAGLSLQQLLGGGKAISITRGNFGDDEEEDGDEDEYDDSQDEDEDEDERGGEEGADDDDVYFDVEDVNGEDDEDGSVQLTVSNSDESDSFMRASSSGNGNGKLKVVMTDEFANNTFGESRTFDDSTPSVASVFSAEIIKRSQANGGSGSNSASERVDRESDEWARRRDMALVREMGDSPAYPINSLGAASDTSGDEDDTREELSSRTLHAIRFLHAEGRLTDDQKKMVVLDLLQKSVGPTLSKAEIAFALIIEHIAPTALATRTLGPRKDLRKLDKEGEQSLLELEEMLLSIYHNRDSWSEDE